MERTICRYSVDINCIFGCFGTRLCKLVSLYPYGIVVNLITFSDFLLQEIVSSQEGKTQEGIKLNCSCNSAG